MTPLTKRLNDELNESEAEWLKLLSVYTESDLVKKNLELIRLARLGLWAEQHKSDIACGACLVVPEFMSYFIDSKLKHLEQG